MPENQPICRRGVWRPKLAGTRTVAGGFCGDSSAVVRGAGTQSFVSFDSLIPVPRDYLTDVVSAHPSRAEHGGDGGSLEDELCFDEIEHGQSKTALLRFAHVVEIIGLKA
jgi:hypothetical protein